ncbi:MAG: hypothetical protein JRJ44_03240 [Deltaproteobacteria bacterium]|nr:hypothetical protein [Deltaproteobacteria bacterium]
MATLLQEAFDKALRLSMTDQDLIGGWMLAEMESEKCWNKLFTNSGNLLS